MTASITFQADHVEVKGLFGQALCSASGFGAHVGCGSWLCENSSARRARRNISKKLRNMESNRAACTMLDTLSENCIFYISPMYEFSHRLGHSRHSRHPGVSGSPQERTFGQCPHLDWSGGAHDVELLFAEGKHCSALKRVPALRRLTEGGPSLAPAEEYQA